MVSEKSAAVVNHNHSQEVKRPCHEANLIDTSFYITKIDNSSCCMYIFDPADLVTFSVDL